VGALRREKEKPRPEESSEPAHYTGWLMYLSRRRGEVPPLPAPVRVEPVEDQGSLIVLTPERFNTDNPEHVALADQVRALLEQAGVLKGYGDYGPFPS
jgi:hypothetical protein